MLNVHKVKSMLNVHKVKSFRVAFFLDFYKLNLLVVFRAQNHPQRTMTDH